MSFSRFLSSIGILLLTMAFSAPVPCFAIEPVNSEELEDYNLTDEDIASRCASAIAQKADLVTTDDGRRIPSCVHTYETARAVALQYRSTEHSSVQKVQSTGEECKDNNTQENCLSSGSEVAAKAIVVHQTLEDTAERGETQLQQFSVSLD